MSTVQKNPTQMTGAHFTQSEKDYMRIYAAKNRTTISSVIRQAVANELSKIADPDNPFFIAKNNT